MGVLARRGCMWKYFLFNIGLVRKNTVKFCEEALGIEIVDRRCVKLVWRTEGESECGRQPELGCGVKEV